ncbi:MAG: N-acetylmuramoyl-L-alanine amidase [Marinicaulis sp.]|nr:N-acetylmuramoyl-L-alanine amidase [Marinicaulis sp.]
MKIIDTPSPNFDDRGRAIDMIVLHYTGMTSGKAALDRLRDEETNVSAHYLVEENGDVYRLVDERNRAWHAGLSSWQGDTETNARSIGIEIVNPGHEFGYRDFPEAQVGAVIDLVADIRIRREISPALVLGHSDVAPRRKEDPGEKFPWGLLAANGHCITPFNGEGDASISYEDALAALSDIGYDAPAGDHAAALLAFQRRFSPQALGQGFNGVTKAALIYARDAKALVA